MLLNVRFVVCWKWRRTVKCAQGEVVSGYRSDAGDIKRKIVELMNSQQLLISQQAGVRRLAERNIEELQFQARSVSVQKITSACLITKLEEDVERLSQFLKLRTENQELQNQMQNCRSTGIYAIPFDLCVDILIKALMSDPRRVIGDFLLISRYVNHITKTEEFAAQFNRVCHHSNRKHLIIQATLKHFAENRLWELILEEGQDPVLKEGFCLRYGIEMIGTHTTFVALADKEGGWLQLFDWFSRETHDIGSSDVDNSDLLVYKYGHNLQVVKVRDLCFCQMKVAAKDFHWSTPRLICVESATVGHGCGTAKFFAFLLKKKSKTIVLIRLDVCTKQLYEDTLPEFAEECSLDVIDRNDKINLCRIGYFDGLKIFTFDDVNRSWQALADYNLHVITGLGFLGSWRVFGVGGDLILVTFCGHIKVIDITSSKEIYSSDIARNPESWVIADSIDGCRCSRLKVVGKKLSRRARDIVASKTSNGVMCSSSASQFPQGN